MMNLTRVIELLQLVEYLWQDHHILEVVVYPMRRVGLGRGSIGTTIKIVLRLIVTLTVHSLECHYKPTLHSDVL